MHGGEKSNKNINANDVQGKCSVLKPLVLDFSTGWVFQGLFSSFLNTCFLFFLLVASHLSCSLWDKELRFQGMQA